MENFFCGELCLASNPVRPDLDGTYTLPAFARVNVTLKFGDR